MNNIKIKVSRRPLFGNIQINSQHIFCQVQIYNAKKQKKNLTSKE